MLVSRTLSEIIGAEVWLKFENLQFTAAYKERGALNKLLQLTRRGARRGVIAASAGNHARPSPIMPSGWASRRPSSCRDDTPTVKVTQTARPRRQVVLHGAMFDDAYAKARELALEHGYVFVHPFDDPQIIAGAGTVGGRAVRGRAGPRCDRRSDRRRERPHVRNCHRRARVSSRTSS